MKTPLHVKIAVVAFFPVIVAQANLDWPPPQPWKSGATTVTLLQDGTLTVSGNGAMEDYGYSDTDGYSLNPWKSVKTSITGLVIEDGVTSIGQQAFMNCTNLTSVTIPNSVMSIGHQAFMRCTNMTSVNIPSSVTTIGHQAFAGVQA